MNPVQIQPASRPAMRPPASEPQPGVEGGDFAQLMALQAPAEETAPPARPDEARPARARPATRAPARNAQGETPRDTPDVARPPREKADAARPAEDDAAPLDAAPLDPALAQWLQSLPRPEAPVATTTDEATDASALGATRKQHGLPLARPAADAVEAPELPAAAGARAGHGPQALRSAEKGARDTLQAAEAPPSRSADDGPSAAPAAASEPAPIVSASGFALPAGFEPVTSAAPGTAAPTAAESPVLAVPMPVPLESPEFAQAFGLEISVLARDGIQQAELHLNPAEMGPVSVQIALDGEKARIDFGAQAAATRAVIEASLPELAAALRDAGLTLAGGGVSQHAGSRDDGRRDGQADAGRSGARDRADAVAAAPSRPVLRSRAGPGGVDLYA